MMFIIINLFDKFKLNIDLVKLFEYPIIINAKY